MLPHEKQILEYEKTIAQLKEQDKDQGLLTDEEISKLEGIDTKDIIAFGDGFNDLEMLSVVGKGCIMENASEKLKKALPKNEIIGKNTEDAVANYLKKLYL